MLAIIGGSGFYEWPGGELADERIVTPFGDVSAPIAELRHRESGGHLLFLPRHGLRHQYMPSEINYRANIWALKKMGARQVISVSACGSLREDIHPGDFIIPSQYFDWTRGRRDASFYGNGLVGHVSSANPACPDLSAALLASCKAEGYAVHREKTYACVEGPRLGTRAESFFLRDAARADIVGMTNVPEAFLALEARMNYATLAICTDYDCWRDDPEEHASVEEIIKTFGESVARARRVIAALIKNPPPVDEEQRRAAGDVVLSSPEHRTPAHNELLRVLLA